MKNFQLFCELPELDFIHELLECYGLTGFDQNIEFCKSDLVDLKTVDKLENILPYIVPYYLPCKAKTYLTEINEKRAITILSQFIKLYAYKLYRKERIIKKKKIIYYKLQKEEDSKLHINSSNRYELLFR
jgi:hypothetical protein